MHFFIDMCWRVTFGNYWLMVVRSTLSFIIWLSPQCSCDPCLHDHIQLLTWTAREPATVPHILDSILHRLLHPTQIHVGGLLFIATFVLRVESYGVTLYSSNLTSGLNTDL